MGRAADEEYLRRVSATVEVHAAISGLPAGRWLLAVSGGRDSMVLLHAMALDPARGAPGIQHVGRRLGEVEALALERHLAHRHAADVEQVADQARHVLGLPVDHRARVHRGRLGQLDRNQRPESAHLRHGHRMRRIVDQSRVAHRPHRRVAGQHGRQRCHDGQLADQGGQQELLGGQEADVLGHRGSATPHRRTARPREPRAG